MSDREIFESKFTVPFGVIWAEENNEYLPDDPFADKETWDSMRRLAGRHNAKFEGYLAGRESLREELAAAKTDAERYRWLTKQLGRLRIDVRGSIATTYVELNGASEPIDEFFDAAIAEGEK